ncbi:MAG: Rne/Rng family ribonuclease [Planctomycetes bacterium]|nr:Rne/Rng family ribonuclease [Planctomycetota bacterium]
MAQKLLINEADPGERRVALVEDGTLVEYWVERAGGHPLVGNIFKGKVTQLEPSIQAAFVEIGTGRNGFLHVSDVLPCYAGAAGLPLDRLSSSTGGRPGRIQDALRRNQEVIVQVTKEEIGRKGVGLTTRISLAGRYLVLMPGIARTGISKKISNPEIRSSLRETLRGIDLPVGIGAILRTAGAEAARKDLERDLRYLTHRWEDLVRKAESVPAPALLCEEQDLVLRALRDLAGTAIDEIIFDLPETCERAGRFLADVVPEHAGKATLYRGQVPLFHKYDVERQVRRIYHRRLSLPSGGSIAIEETEAMVAIDVNSGRCRSEESLEATALRTNLEAAGEIVRQLRLRDHGGVVVIDFIDMREAAHRLEVERALRSAFRSDRAKVWMGRISRFGLLELTRQRVRPSVEQATRVRCPCCEGRGLIPSVAEVVIQLRRELRWALTAKRKRIVRARACGPIVKALQDGGFVELQALAERVRKQLHVVTDDGIPADRYEIEYP